jgi:hypothetical protein
VPLNEQFAQSVYERFLRLLNLLDEGRWRVESESHWEVYLKSILHLYQMDFMLLKEKAFGLAFVDIQTFFTNLKAVDKTTMANRTRLASELSSEVPEPKGALSSRGDSISTLLADIEAEFRRREQEKEDLLLKWANEGTDSKHIALLILPVT